MINLEKDMFLKEHFDYSDRDTVKYLAEAGDDKVLMALTSKLYEKILEKYDKIDFSTISRSRGDITKIEKYDSLVECVEIVNRLVKEYNEDTYPVDVVSSAMENIRSRTTMFKKGFTFGSSIIMVTYNTMVAAIIESVSFLIATCVEYIKVPGNETFKMALDTVAYNNTKTNLFFESLATFNQGCASGEFDKAMEVCLSNKKAHHEAAEEVQIANDSPFLEPEGEEDEDQEVVIHDVKEKAPVKEESEEVEDDDTDLEAFIAAPLVEALLKEDDTTNNEIEPADVRAQHMAVQKPAEAIKEEGFFQATSYVVSRAFFFLGKFLVPALRNLVYYFYSKRQAKSDYYADMAQLVQMNMFELQQNSSIDAAKKEKILAKQDKIYQNYMRKKNKYAIDYTVGRKSVDKMIKDEDKKITVKDLDSDSGEAFDGMSTVLF